MAGAESSLLPLLSSSSSQRSPPAGTAAIGPGRSERDTRSRSRSGSSGSSTCSVSIDTHTHSGSGSGSGSGTHTHTGTGTGTGTHTHTHTRTHTGMHAADLRPHDVVAPCPFATASPAKTPDSACTTHARRQEPGCAAVKQNYEQQHSSSSTPATHRHAEPSPPLSDDSRPLRTASVRADTTLAHPKPIAFPPPLGRRPPDSLVRSGSATGNIAQLEATAERLSMTSSIDDAIRELHCELKRSDSRRSARLGLPTMASVDENSASSPSLASRHLTTRASILSLNSAARHGGYSPAGFVMSPNTSLTSRLPSGSSHSSARGDVITLDYILSRHGTARSSMRSVRSGKLSLAEISESDPVSLNQQAFDEADAAPPLEDQSPEALQLTRGTTEAPSSPPDALHHMMPDHHSLASQALDHHYSTMASTRSAVQQNHAYTSRGQAQRPASVHSANTFEQARDAFIDFDGVHWEAPDEETLSHHTQQEVDSALTSPRPAPASAPAPVSMARPASFIDLSTGNNMLYYPARVPAMLNLPPKLSSNPKSAGRDNRRSRICSAMTDADSPDLSTSPQRPRRLHRNSRHGNFGLASSSSEVPIRESWLPDPVADHRNSFAALSSFGGPFDALDPQGVPPADEKPPSLLAETEFFDRGEAVPDYHLRRPERLSKASTNNRKSVMSMLSNLPSQLRASAFFDFPSASPEIEIKNGSAMATLDSILDASATAPVSAFTDHPYAGKLGPETYGKQKKQKKMQSSAAATQAQAQAPLATPILPKKRSSMMWLSKRFSSQDLTKFDDASFSDDGRQRLSSVNPADKSIRAGAENSQVYNEQQQQEAAENEKKEEEEEEEETEEQDDPDESYYGPPTTLLAELQLRKQQQKQRVRNMGQGLPNSNYATLLEMDTIAETQKKNRQNRRVNLAWEAADAPLDQDETDDEDVPLAIIAAMQRGAKNLADLERPLGLMERREMEDNEPLSHRRARLQGIEPPPPPPLLRPAISQHPSMMSLSASRCFEGIQPLQPEAVTPGATSQTPVEVEEIEEETLGNRRRRLTTKDGELPKTRPVSSSFSAELLSQFGSPKESKTQAKDDKEGGPMADAAGEEEETLGQRRRRLQAEREARDREMGLGNAAAAQSQPGPDDRQQQRLSLANVLSAHPVRREADKRMQEEKLRQDSERRETQARESKMTALRMQMPTALPQLNIERSGGYLGGAFNDGLGGQGLKAASSIPNLNTYGLSSARGNRASLMSGAYGVGVPSYGFAPTTGANTQPQVSFGTKSVYGASGPLVSVQTPSRSMDRVEQWRYSVRP
ncbi:hypothetical protein E4U21_000970 [Claviceps maximensis]|nr:hypothetical protein E4U21_000970 [Claviceps maximensis]